MDFWQILSIVLFALCVGALWNQWRGVRRARRAAYVKEEKRLAALPKRFCSECGWRVDGGPGDGMYRYRCVHENNLYDSAQAKNGRQADWPSFKNKRNRCKDFEPKDAVTDEQRDRWGSLSPLGRGWRP